MDETYDFHPLADSFPLMEGQEFDELKRDVLAHGVIEPLVLHDGKILDGRNRYRAAKATGQDFATAAWDEIGDPVDYVMSMNLYRRHLTPSQRAMAGKAVMHHEAKAAKGRKEKGREKGGKTGGRNRKKENSLVENLPQSFGEDEGKARDLAGKKLGVSGKLVEAGVKVNEVGSAELQRAVQRGDVAVTQAAKLIEAVPDKKEQSRLVALVKRDPAGGKAAINAKIKGHKAGAALAKEKWTPKALTREVALDIKTRIDALLAHTSKSAMEISTVFVSREIKELHALLLQLF